MIFTAYSVQTSNFTKKGFLKPIESIKKSCPSGIGAELDLVDGQEFDRHIERHRLHGTDPVPWLVGDALLLTGDEGDLLLPNLCCDPIVDLSCQQAERQPDHPAATREHALHRRRQPHQDRDQARHRGSIELRVEVLGGSGVDESVFDT